jgi:hypothetical protein
VAVAQIFQQMRFLPTISVLISCAFTLKLGSEQQLVLSADDQCDESCRLICLRNGGGKACLEACKCDPRDCDEECKAICIEENLGEDCIRTW